MKTKFLFAFLFLTKVFFGQNNASACAYCGIYDGKLAKYEKTDTTLISVKLELKKDSLFSYAIDGKFTSCTSRTFNGTGKWFSEGGLLFMKPDPNEDNIIVFIIKDSRDEEKILKAEADLEKKYYWQGFEYCLKFTDANCPKLFFRLSWDCFKSVWKNNSIQKANCK